jgi:hypothetical protein
MSNLIKLLTLPYTILLFVLDCIIYLLEIASILVEKFFKNLVKFFTFLFEFLAFLNKSTYAIKNYHYFFIFAVISYTHNFFLINEEILVAFCFYTAVTLIVTNTQQSVTESLDERSENIRKELSSFLLLEQENIMELYKSEQSLLNTTQNVTILQKYCRNHFVELTNSQEKALVGLVSKNLFSKLDVLQGLNKTLYPSLKKQMKTSLRETIMEHRENGSNH